MTRKEYKEILEYELYHGKKYSLIQRIRIKYFQPNTNCMFLCRKMWFEYSRERVIYKYISKLLYLRICHKYGCIIYPSAVVGKGFNIAHPVGIVIGKCVIGREFTVYQNTTIGVRREGDEARGFTPIIGDNVRLCSGAMVLGKITITNDVTIGAGAIVLNDISEAGTYIGAPAQKNN